MCITFGYGQNTKFKTGKTDSKNYFTKIKYKNVKSKIIIPVLVEGKTYQFLFDTGAPNVISSEILKTLNNKPLKSLTISDSNNREGTMQLTQLSALSIGNITFRNTSALIFEDEGNVIFDCYEVDGIIGSNLLRKSVVQINAKNKELIITNKIKNLEVESNAPSKLTLVGGQGSPYIEIKLKGEKTASESLLFDTGATGFYDMTEEHFNLFKNNNIAVTISKGKGASGMGLFGASEVNDKYRLKIPSITVNNYDFKNVWTTTTSDSNSRIGAEILDYGIVTLDFRMKNFYFEGFDNPTDLNEKLLGFTPIIDNNKLVVGVVWDKELKDKVSYGDEIISINTFSVANANICDFFTNKSIFKSSDILKITFKTKEGELNTYNLKREFIH